MAVEIGVAMPGKMFATGQDPSRVQSVGECECVFDHGFRCASERPIANDGVAGVGVDVEHWREIQIDSNRAQLSAEDPCCLTSQESIPGRR